MINYMGTIKFLAVKLELPRRLQLSLPSLFAESVISGQEMSLAQKAGDEKRVWTYLRRGATQVVLIWRRGPFGAFTG